MRILSRYVLLEFLKVFLATLAGTTLLIMIVGVVQEALQQGIGLTQTLRIVPYLLPEALRYAVPATTLFAASNVYGRISAGNEVLAIKASGLSPLIVLWPVIGLAVILSVVGVWLNDVAVSWGRAGVRRVVVESVEQIAYAVLNTQRSYTSRHMSINVRRVEDRQLISPTFWLNAKSDTPSITITADRAEMRSDVDAGTLTIRFTNAQIDVGNRGAIDWPDVYEHVVELDEVSRKSSKSIGPSECPLRRIPTEIRRQHTQIARLEQQAATAAALAMMSGDFPGLVGPGWNARQEQMATAQRQLSRLETEPQRRWANGFSCLCFVLVGAPLAIHRRKGEFWTNFVLCFFPILLVYYPLLIGAVKQSKTGAWPPETVWMGNVVLLLWGLWLLRKVVRY